jgi:hypothetical protein
MQQWADQVAAEIGYTTNPLNPVGTRPYHVRTPINPTIHSSITPFLQHSIIPIPNVATSAENVATFVATLTSKITRFYRHCCDVAISREDHPPSPVPGSKFDGSRFKIRRSFPNSLTHTCSDPRLSAPIRTYPRYEISNRSPITNYKSPVTKFELLRPTSSYFELLRVSARARL